MLPLSGIAKRHANLPHENGHEGYICWLLQYEYDELHQNFRGFSLYFFFKPTLWICCVK